MKKYIVGFIAGIVFMISTSVFADTISLVGKKVTGEYNIVVNNENLPEKGAIIDSKANVPVRAISEALGADVKVEGKTIVITTEEVETPVSSNTNNGTSSDISTLKAERENVANEITRHENAIKNYEDKYIPSTERAIKIVISPEAKQEYMDQLEKEKKELEALKVKLADLQKQLAEIDAKIAELEK